MNFLLIFLWFLHWEVKAPPSQIGYINQDGKAQLRSPNTQYCSPVLPADVSLSASRSLSSDQKSPFEHCTVKGCLAFFIPPANLCLHPSDFERNSRNLVCQIIFKIFFNSQTTVTKSKLVSAFSS